MALLKTRVGAGPTPAEKKALAGWRKEWQAKARKNPDGSGGYLLEFDESTLAELDKFKFRPDEPYSDVIARILDELPKDGQNRRVGTRLARKGFRQPKKGKR